MLAILRAWRGHKCGSREDDPNVPSATWRRRMWPSPDSNFSSPEQVMTTCLPQSYSDDKVGELSCIPSDPRSTNHLSGINIVSIKKKVGENPQMKAHF